MLTDQQILSQIGDAKKGVGDVRAVAPEIHQRERGLWSFLTWSFFISQIVAAITLSGESAKAADAVDLSSRTDSSPNAIVGGALAELQYSSFPETATADPASTSSRLDKGAASDSAKSTSQDTTEVSGHGEASSQLKSLGNSTNSVADGTAVSGDVSSATPADSGTDITVPAIDLGDLSSPFVNGLIGPIVNPVFNLVEDILTSTAGGPVGQLLDAVTDDVVVPVLAPVQNILESVTTPLVQLPLFGDVTDALSATAPQISEPISDVITLGGNLSFPESLAQQGKIDVLFSGGTYTDYNLALQEAQAIEADGRGANANSQITQEMDFLGGDDGHDPAFGGLDNSLKRVDDLDNHHLGDGLYA